MALTFDFTQYKDTSSARVEPGTYRAQVTDFTETVAKSGNTMFEVTLTIVGGTNDGLNIIDRLPQTPKAMFRSAAFLQALGVKIQKKRLQLNPKSLINKVVDIVVEDGEPYNGRVKSEVREYLRAAVKSSPKDIPDEDVEETPDAIAEAEADESTADSSDEVAEIDVDELDIDDLDL